jgi:hypothetical protein
MSIMVHWSLNLIKIEGVVLEMRRWKDYLKMGSIKVKIVAIWVVSFLSRVRRRGKVWRVNLKMIFRSFWGKIGVRVRRIV